MIDRLPPQNLDSEQAVLGSILIDRDAIIEIADFLHAEDFYRQAHGRIFAAMLELFEHREPIDVVTVAEALERAGELEAVGGAGYLSAARQRHPHRRPRRPVRPHRRAQGHPAPPHLGRRQDRGHRLRGRLGHPGVDRPGRGRAVRGQPAPLQRRLQPAALAPPRRLRPARLPAHPPRRDRRHRVGLRGPGPADDRLPGQRPDRPGGPAQRRQDEPRAQHRRARRRPRGQDGRRLQPGDEQGPAGPAPALERRRHRLAAAALGLPRGAGLRPDRPGHAGPLGRADVHRRHAGHQHHGAADQGPPPPGRARAGPADRGLPAADAGHVQQPRRQPRPGGLGDQPRPQGPRPRAEGAGHRPLPAVAPAGDPRRRASRACRTCASPGAIEQDADLVLFLWREKDEAGRGGATRTARSSTCAWPSTATAPPARSSSGSRRARPASSATPPNATPRPV